MPGRGPAAPWSANPREVKLTTEQEEDLVRDGYVRVPDLIPAPRIAAALKAINHSLARGLPPDQVAVYGSRFFCPELQRTSAILDLFHETPARALAESLLGRIEEVRTGQIALAFPQMEPPAPPYPHLDGLHTPTNGVPPGEVRSFTLLVGVMLSEVRAPGAGNLTVWPGSHRLYESYFRDAVYFRLKARGHDGRRWECLTDLWKEWPGIRERRP